MGDWGGTREAGFKVLLIKFMRYTEILSICVQVSESLFFCYASSSPTVTVTFGHRRKVSGR